jgi:hypothetical protein
MASDFFHRCHSLAPSVHPSRLEQAACPINCLVQFLNRMRVIRFVQGERLISELAELADRIQQFAKRELLIHSSVRAEPKFISL